MEAAGWMAVFLYPKVILCVVLVLVGTACFIAAAANFANIKRHPEMKTRCIKHNIAVLIGAGVLDFILVLANALALVRPHL